MQCIAWEGKEGVSLLCLKEAAQWSSPKGVPGPAWEEAGSCVWPSGSLWAGKGDQGTRLRHRMSAGSTLSPACCWEWGWSSSLRGLWAASRDLCLVFPSCLPPAPSSEQQLPGAPSWLQAKQDQPGTVLLFCVPSIPVPDLAMALPEIFSPSSTSCCFFLEKRLWWSRWDCPMAHPRSCQELFFGSSRVPFPAHSRHSHMWHLRTLLNIFILWVTKENKSFYQHFSECLIKAVCLWQEMGANIRPLKCLYNWYITFSYLIPCLCTRYSVSTFPTQCNTWLYNKHLNSKLFF